MPSEASGPSDSSVVRRECEWASARQVRRIGSSFHLVPDSAFTVFQSLGRGGEGIHHYADRRAVRAAWAVLATMTSTAKPIVPNVVEMRQLSLPKENF